MRGLLSHSQSAGVGIFLEDDLVADIGLIAGVPFGMVIITAVLGQTAEGLNKIGSVLKCYSH